MGTGGTVLLGHGTMTKYEQRLEKKYIIRVTTLHKNSISISAAGHHRACAIVVCIILFKIIRSLVIANELHLFTA